MKRISVANAVFERELASRRVADKYIEALKRGIMSGARRPLGYISGNTPGSAVIDKNASLIVQRIFALCLEGKPRAKSQYSQIANLGEYLCGNLKMGNAILEENLQKIKLGP